MAWQPARFANPVCLSKAGLKSQIYCYRNAPALDASLNRYLIHLRNLPLEPLPAVLTN
ncbi:type III secretion system domain-containing protein [Candidatus Williamhamiltonella defendens]|uniref:type III secretion system domain-containing protein n=1 Tax=Candidatus Williamhamiltonella defendens TaxID=138072 RepID=UPI0022A6842B|nr:type III secretion system domain-containing protein [Candidatus Hamiltonella defensa]